MLTRLSLIVFILLAVRSAMAAPLVLITDFDPFGGSTVNNSTIVAAQVQKRLHERGIDSKICRLPVVYAEGAAQAMKCFAAVPIKPQLVLSLGEGDCDLRVETAGQNLDSEPAAPDNAGNIRDNEPIQPGAPMSLPLRTFIGDMYCSLPKAKRAQLGVSVSPGGYVCNDVAYRLGQAFAATSTLFSFMHVPSNTCGGSLAETQAIGNTVAQMLESLAVLGGHGPTAYAKLGPLMPSSVDQAEQVIRLLRANKQTAARECVEEFTSRVEKQLVNFTPKQSVESYRF